MNSTLEFWPNASDRLLLTAALFEGEKGRQAWQTWLEDFDAVDDESLLIFPLLYRNLQKMGIDDQAPDIIRDAYRQTWFRNQQVFKVAGEAMQALAEAGIEMLVLKGAALMARYYQDYRLRPMHDVDVLIRPDDVTRAVALLTAMGFDLTIALPQTRIPLIHGTTFRTAKHIDFDLHWYMLEECCYPGVDDAVWQAGEPMEIEGLKVLGLSPTDLLMNICIHAARWEPTRSVKWVADSLMVLRQSEINWERLKAEIMRRDLVLPMRETLAYLHTHFDVEIPNLDDLEALPVSRRYRQEYVVKGQPRTYWRRLQFHWFNYLRLQPVVGMHNLLIGFQAYLRRRWGVRSLWHMPGFIRDEIRTRIHTGRSNISAADPVHQIARKLDH